MNWTPIQSIRTLEVSRAFRFRREERGVLLGHLGIADDARVAEIGCGTGVFTRYLADGIPKGCVLGIDVTAEFVAFATERRSAANVSFAAGDAYASRSPTAASTRSRAIRCSPSYATRPRHCASR